MLCARPRCGTSRRGRIAEAWWAQSAIGLLEYEGSAVEQGRSIERLPYGSPRNPSSINSGPEESAAANAQRTNSLTNRVEDLVQLMRVTRRSIA